MIKRVEGRAVILYNEKTKQKIIGKQEGSFRQPNNIMFLFMLFNTMYINYCTLNIEAKSAYIKIYYDL